MKTKNGKNIPVDVPSIENETARDAVLYAAENQFNSDYMIAHIATCPNANQQRKR